MELHHPRLDYALAAIEASCLVARGVQRDVDRVRSITKDDRSPVTVADFAVQAIVSMALHEADPSARVVGEERADVLRQSEQAGVRAAVVEAVRAVRPNATEDEVLGAIDACDHDGTDATYWTLDPVDGTKGFLRGQQYAVALGLIENGRVTLGVMGCPNLPIDHGSPLDEADVTGAIYAAARGHGTWEMRGPGLARGRGAPRQVHAAAFHGEGSMRVCESVEAAHSKQTDTSRILDALGGLADPVRLDSQCKYAVVARGQAHAYMRLPTKKGYVEKIWDHAAGSLVAIEAGAVVSDITGAALDFAHGPRLEANRGVICAAAGLHARIIEAIQELGIAAPA